MMLIMAVKSERISASKYTLVYHDYPSPPSNCEALQWFADAACGNDDFVGATKFGSPTQDITMPSDSSREQSPLRLSGKS